MPERARFWVLRRQALAPGPRAGRYRATWPPVIHIPISTIRSRGRVLGRTMTGSIWQAGSGASGDDSRIAPAVSARHPWVLGVGVGVEASYAVTTRPG